MLRMSIPLIYNVREDERSHLSWLSQQETISSVVDRASTSSSRGQLRPSSSQLGCRLRNVQLGGLLLLVLENISVYSSPLDCSPNRLSIEHHCDISGWLAARRVFAQVLSLKSRYWPKRTQLQPAATLSANTLSANTALRPSTIVSPGTRRVASLSLFI